MSDHRERPDVRAELKRLSDEYAYECERPFGGDPGLRYRLRRELHAAIDALALPPAAANADAVDAQRWRTKRRIDLEKFMSDKVFQRAAAEDQEIRIGIRERNLMDTKHTPPLMSEEQITTPFDSKDLPAFPCKDRGDGFSDSGMSLRDYFATHAPPMDDKYHKDMQAASDDIVYREDAISSWNYAYADAMLVARQS